MRGWPRSITSIVLVRPMIAPSFTIGLSHLMPVASMPNAIGAGTLSCVYLTMPVSTSATATYRIVQITSDTMMPIGMSRCGFRASCAAVDTASNPMNAKKITPAPRSTPLHPKTPKWPSLGGTNGCQFARLMYAAPNATNNSSTTTLMITITVLSPADSRMPMMRSTEIASTTSAASTLNTPCTVLPPGSVTTDPGGPAHRAEMPNPKSCRKLWTLPAHPTAMVDAPRAYSRIRSQPMIQANSSPNVAYAYV